VDQACDTDITYILFLKRFFWQLAIVGLPSSNVLSW
jgi:hypothetical protein